MTGLSAVMQSYFPCPLASHFSHIQQFTALPGARMELTVSLITSVCQLLQRVVLHLSPLKSKNDFVLVCLQQLLQLPEGSTDAAVRCVVAALMCSLLQNLPADAELFADLGAHEGLLRRCCAFLLRASTTAPTSPGMVQDWWRSGELANIDAARALACVVNKVSVSALPAL